MRSFSALVLLASSLVGLVKAANVTNPIRMNGPDPFIVWDNDTQKYYFTHTTGVDLELTSAKTLDGLRGNPDRSVRYSNTSMIKYSTVWAPEIHKLWDKWYFYYSLQQRPYAVEIGDKLTDDFNSSVPVGLSPDAWGIDGTVLNLNNDHYFVWSCQRTFMTPSKNESYNTNKTEQSLCISKFNNATSIDLDNIGVISQPTELWEQAGFPVNEGPQPIYWQNETYLTYSASFCGTANYSLGLLRYTGGDPISNSSWSKKTDGPVFSSSNGNYGTGHNGMFTSPDGSELWVVYHAVQNPKGACDGTRATFVQPVNLTNFDAETGPTFDPAPYYGVRLPGPSGEQKEPETINDVWPFGCYECWTDGGLGTLN